jgi:aspartyl/asparaginyl-tRNA synthetase
MYQNYVPSYSQTTYHILTKKLRTFFEEKGYEEVHTQDRLSILAACEDPSTVQTFVYHGEVWPLPQTGQMWLEYELLSRPNVPGVFCLSTSYRNEPHPIPGRHQTIFPMFEFESRGTVEDLYTLECELLEYIGIQHKEQVPTYTYDELSKKYHTRDLTSEHEMQMAMDIGPVVAITKFPEHTSPFWNMKRNEEGTADKIDVILCGMETFGTAAREVDPIIMQERFHTISDGAYAELLYNKFGKTRVERELHEFLSFDFFPRFGGGIGMTRLVRAYEMLHNKESLIINTTAQVVA